MTAYDDTGNGARPAATRDRAARLLDELSAGALESRHVMVYGDDDLLTVDEAMATPPPADAPLRRYLKYQVRDFVKQRGVWLALLALGGVYLLWYNYDMVQVAERFEEARRAGGNMQMAGARDEPGVFQSFATMLGLAVAAFGGVFATHGIVSQERERGQQRFLFAKPIPLVPYYLQKLAVALVGTLGVVLGTMFVMALVFQRAVPFDVALGVGALLTVTLGSLTFFLSTLVRFEAALAVMLAFAVVPITAQSHQPGWEWLRAVRYLLPPMESIARVLDNPALGATLTNVPGTLVWVGAYAAACIAAGVAVLRRRSILT